MPIFLVDPEGTLVYYNEPAERLLGYRYDETGEMPSASGRRSSCRATTTGSRFPPSSCRSAIAFGTRRTGPRHDLDRRPRRRDRTTSRSPRSRSSGSTTASSVRWPSSGRPPSHEGPVLGHPRLAADARARRPRATAATRRASRCGGTAADHVIVLDAGTGIRALGADAAAERRSESTCCSRICTWTTSSVSGSSTRSSGPGSRCNLGAELHDAGAARAAHPLPVAAAVPGPSARPALPADPPRRAARDVRAPRRRR